MLHSNINTKKITVVDFMNWPIEVREQFIEKNMPKAHECIKIPLLRNSNAKKERFNESVQ